MSHRGAGRGCIALTDVGTFSLPVPSPTPADVVAAAQAAWPKVTFDVKVTAAHLARLQRPLGEHLDGLALAAEALAGNRKALAELDRLLARASGGLSRLGDAARLDDALALARERLLLGGSKGPRLLQYKGVSPLEPWLRTSVVRLLLNLQRGREDAAEPKLLEAMVGVLEESRGLEAGALKRRHAPTFRKAFAEAVAKLGAKEREALHRSAQGESIDLIGERFGVHRATAARWLADARTKLREFTLEALQDALELSAREANSLAQTLRGAAEVSLARWLAPEVSGGSRSR